MHVLWLKTELLHPVDKGGRIRTYHTVRRLSHHHRVTYLTLDDGTAAPDAAERAMEYCDRLIRIPFQPPAKYTPAFYLELARNLTAPLPYAVSRYASSEMTEQIRRCVREEHVDLLVCDFLAPSVNVPAQLSCPTLLFQHNVEAEIWRRHAANADTWLKRRFFTLQWRRMIRFEAGECQRYDHVVAVSEQDRSVFERYGARAVSAVPTGVDIDFFRPMERRSDAPLIVFTGSMDWLPNHDGMMFFLDGILPLIRARFPAARFRIVGRDPRRDLVERAEAVGVDVTGFVDDVRPHVADATVIVVPLRIGGGTRLKIFEAMAMNRPVVSTTVGAEGLPLEPGEHLMIADEPDRFAAAVVELLSDEAQAEELGTRGGAYVREHFGWDSVGDEFTRQCEAAAGSHIRTETRHRPPPLP